MADEIDPSKVVVESPIDPAKVVVADTSVGDVAKSFAAGAVDAFGLAAQGAGNIIGQAATRGLRAAGVEIPGGIPAVNPLESVSTAIRESKTPGGKVAAELSQPTGVITDPSTWSLGSAPTIGGYAQNAADVIGQFAMPAGVAAASKVAKLGGAAQTGVGAITGAAQAGGAASGEEGAKIRDKKALPDEELAKASSTYRDYLARGLSPAEARERTAADVELGAGLVGAVPAGAEGAILQGLFRGKLKMPTVGSGAAARIASGAAGGAVAEGAQETLEGVAQRLGANIAGGQDQPLLEDSFANALLGAIGGKVAGGAFAAIEMADEKARKLAEDELAKKPKIAGLLPAPGGTVIPMPPGGGGPNLEAEAADINAGAIYGARDAYEAEQAALRAANAAKPPPLALPAPGMPLGNMVLPNDGGPFSVTQQHIANDAQDHANSVEAAREAEIVRLESSGPIGRAAAASMRSGADRMASEQRNEEAQQPKSPLALPEPAGELEKRGQQKLTQFAADLPAGPLAGAQQVARLATERSGLPMTVIPHPGGSGYTVVPSNVVPDALRDRFAGIQRDGTLPSPRPPESQFAGSPAGDVSRQPVPEGMRSAVADWRRDMGTPTPKGAEPTGAKPEPTPPQPPLKKREAAVAKAEKLTAETGREHEVVPHPFMRGAFAVRPVANVQQSSRSTDTSQQQNAYTNQENLDTSSERVQESDVSTDRGQGQGVGAASAIDERAHEAATSLQNDLPQPTSAQAGAGNYRKGHVKVHGLDVSIENPAGSVRVGESEDGNAWASSMPHHYGYIRRSEGADGDHVDTFIGPNPESTKVFVVDQIDPKTGKFDEHKVMLGFDSQEAAEAGYRAAYPKGWKGMGVVSAIDVDGLKSWLKDGDTKRAFSAKESTQTPKLTGKDLDGIVVREPVQVEETGETVYIERDAKEALVESRSRVRKLEALLKCMKS